MATTSTTTSTPEGTATRWSIYKAELTVEAAIELIGDEDLSGSYAEWFGQHFGRLWYTETPAWVEVRNYGGHLSDAKLYLPEETPEFNSIAACQQEALVVAWNRAITETQA